MADLAAAHPGQVTLLGYNYLRSPAFQAARALVAEWVIGQPLAIRGVYDEDYSADPTLPWSWRMTHQGAVWARLAIWAAIWSASWSR